MQKNKVAISGRLPISKFFKNSEILSVEPISYRFIDRKKIIVFTPVDHTDKIANAMFKAGAGIIGNYKMCSFRTNGTGTYKPDAKANPHSGKRGKLSQENEIKLEIECGEEILDEVLEAMIEVHPYEEIAYEIYDFKKRENVSDGAVITLKKGIEYPEFLLRVNKKMSSEDVKTIRPKKSLKKIAITEGPEKEIYIKKSMQKKADAIMFIDKKINLIIL